MDRLNLNFGKVEQVFERDGLDAYLNYLRGNLAKISFTDLRSCFASSKDDYTQDELVEKAISFAKKIITESIDPKNCARATQRNRKNVTSGKHPLTPGSITHGVPIEHLFKKALGLLAAELDGGETFSMNNLILRLYVSLVPNFQNNEPIDLMDKVRELIPSARMKGLEKGTVLLILDSDSKFKTELRSPISSNLDFAVPFGVPSTDIKACIVTDQNDVLEVKEALKRFLIYIPLYNEQDELLFTFEEWDAYTNIPSISAEARMSA